VHDAYRKEVVSAYIVHEAAPDRVTVEWIGSIQICLVVRCSRKAPRVTLCLQQMNDASSRAGGWRTSCEVHGMMVNEASIDVER